MPFPFPEKPLRNISKYANISGVYFFTRVRDRGDNMEIAIVGSGCARCKQTAEVVRKAVEHAGVDATISKVEDIREIMKFQVLKTPAVTVDGEVKISGRVPTVEEITSLLTP
jgi:small redox-active disulfide protein 2